MSWEALGTPGSPPHTNALTEKHMDLLLYIHLFKVNEFKIKNGIKACSINQFVKHPDDHK